MLLTPQGHLNVSKTLMAVSESSKEQCSGSEGPIGLWYRLLWHFCASIIVGNS